MPISAPKVSIIIPVFKVGYLAAALRSVFEQTFEDYEVIVVNDGSPFDVAACIEPWSGIGKLRLINQSNRGVAAARNRGAHEARGEFLAFLDDDDCWPSQKLEWQVEILQSYDSLAVIAGAHQMMDATGASLRAVPFLDGDLTFEALFSGCPFISPGQTLIRASDFHEVGGFDETIWGADDFDLWLKLAKRKRIDRRTTCALYYRLHSSNASRNAHSMCNGLLRIIQTHLPSVATERRCASQRSALRWLYDYCGRRAIETSKSALLKGDFSLLGECTLMLLRLFPFACRDLELLRRILLDLLPARIAYSS